MTLLETLVALVILGLAAVGFLDLFQQVTRHTRDTVMWTHAVQVAEATMEQAILDDRAAFTDTLAGFRRRVDVTPWRDGMRDIVVQVALPAPGTARIELHRLVPPR